MPDEYCEGFDEAVIGIFDDASQAGKLLRVIQQLDSFDCNSERHFIDALMEIAREVAEHDSEAAKVQER